MDANYNRAKEAFRVCEDVCRFFLEAPSLTRSYKNCRHDLTEQMMALVVGDLIKSRNVRTDVGRSSTAVEMKRKGMGDIFYANSQRAKESVRVLEECAKLVDVKVAEKIKKLRYKIYVIEKKVIEQL